jgi:hypothetical protein
MFRLMEPLHHDADPNRSQVLAHIMANMRCDMGRAIRAFNSMRHPKSKVLVFDAIHRMWKGCDWVPADNDSKDSMFIIELRTLQRRVIAMDSELKKAGKEIKRLSKKTASRNSVEDSSDSTESDWSGELRKALDTTNQSVKSAVDAAWR